MTQLPGNDEVRGADLGPVPADLAAVVRDVRLEIDAEEAAYPDGTVVASAAELGYYEAELRSLRGAATSLGEAESVVE
jgi:hypothetical protein